MPQCSDIRGITDPAEICEIGKRYCGLDSLIPYSRIVFCYLQSQSARIGFLSVSTLIVSGAMGVAAFDYLSANLTYIAEISALPQSLIGVTILAFGNGSVDVFGSFVAFASDEGGMAVGEIMGGAFFVVTVVVGSMAIISPFKVNKTVPKDIFVLQLAILYIFLVIRDGSIKIYESLFGIVAYIGYSIWVVLSQINDTESDILNMPPSEIPEELMSRLPSPHNPDEGDLVDNTIYAPIRPSLYSAVDLNRRVHMRLEEIDHSEFVVPRVPMRCHTVIDPPQQQPKTAENENSSESTGIESPHSSLETSTSDIYKNNTQVFERGNSKPLHFRRRSSAPEVHMVRGDTETDPFNSMIPNSHHTPLKASHLDLPKLSITGTTSSSARTSPVPSEASVNTNFLIPPEPHQPRHMRSFQKRHKKLPYSMKELVDKLLNAHEMDIQFNTPEANDRERSLSPFSELAEPPSGSESELESELPSNDSLLAALCPPLAKWGEKTWLHRCVMIPMLPILTLLSWTVPLSANAGSLLQICIHCVAVPFTIPKLIPSFSYTLRTVIVEGVVASAGLIWWLYLRKPLPPRLAVSAVGFIMGILWVVLLATELVGVLTLLGEVCRVSNTILGLTVFALGDSLGDFVSNITVAEIGYPTMAVAACYGGPIFTLLIGVCGSSFMTMLIRGVPTLSVSAHGTLTVSAIAILLTLTVLQIQLMKNDYHIDKMIGIELIIIWAVYIVCSVFFFRS